VPNVIVPSYHYMIGPTLALAMLGVIVLICRWTFSTKIRDDRMARARAAARERGDFGLLVPVATTRSVDDADLLRGVLCGAGIRSTVTAGDGGGWRLMVFRQDATRAESLIGTQRAG
jgi:hypothetical protein